MPVVRCDSERDVTVTLSFSSAPANVLIIVTRRIGDVLLTAPLIRTLKQAWPATSIDVLAFRGTEGILAANPDVAQIITVSKRASARQAWRQLHSLRRRYDLALSTSPSDRPTLYAWWAGRRRLGVMDIGAKHAWKRALLDGTVPFDNYAVHTVVQNLWLADALGLSRCFEMPLLPSANDESVLEQLFPAHATTPYVVFHVYPKFAYKMWAPEQWCALGAGLHRRGLRVVLSGSPEPQEMAYVARLAGTFSEAPLNLCGKLDFGQLALLISRGKLYVGPDTVTTHLAAATGTPTVALFGPSNPVKWGPWPHGCTAQTSPWVRQGTQIVGNVALVQGFGACVPCLEEGCARDESSHSVCLQMLTATTVMQSADALLASMQRPLAQAT